MRILLLTQWFDPEPTFKGLTFATALRNRGHDVHVLTGFPNYPGGRLYPGYSLRLTQLERIEDIPVRRVWLYPSHDRSAIGRSLNYLSFAAAAALVGVPRMPRPDVIYCYHPPATASIPALLMRSLFGCPVVYDVQDLWPETIAATGMVKSPVVMSALAAFSRGVYKRMNRLAVLSPGFRERLVKMGVSPEKIDVIYNWADEKALSKCSPGLSPRRLEELRGKFVVMFAGTMGLAQGLDTVLDAAAICAGEVPRAHFVFIGGGVDRERLVARSGSLGLQNVTFLDRVPPDSIGPVLQEADALLVHLRDDPLFSITIPSKTQAYLAAGKPIIMAVRGDAADLVLRAGAGFTCEPGDAAGLAAAVGTAAAMPPEELAKLGERGKRYYEEHLSLAAGVARFEKAFQRAIAEK